MNFFQNKSLLNEIHFQQSFAKLAVIYINARLVARARTLSFPFVS